MTFKINFHHKIIILTDSNVRGFGFSEDFAAGMVLCVILLCNDYAFGTVSEEDN
jgi:hypothetical protein